jgi:hypothetical protein
MLAAEQTQAVDPDPFTIGLGIFGAVAGGGAFLESRRQRRMLQEQQRGAFRGAWYASRRTLIHFKQQVDEFETYMLEDGYGKHEFRIGVVACRSIAAGTTRFAGFGGQTFVTADRLGDNLDDLSEFLGEDYGDEIEMILRRLHDMQIPATYRDVIRTARDAFEWYGSFLDHVAEREGFEIHAT